MSHRHLSRRLALVAGTAVALGAGAAPALAASGPQPTTRTLKSEIKQADSTPLGRAIVRQGDLTRLDLSLTRGHIKGISANLAARKRAEAVVKAIAPQPTGDQAEIKREWLKGERYLVASDQLLLDYIRSGKGPVGNHQRITGLDEGTYGSDLTGWAFIALWSKPGPLPRPWRSLPRL